jgi:hypothetical protein
VNYRLKIYFKDGYLQEQENITLSETDHANLIKAFGEHAGYCFKFENAVACIDLGQVYRLDIIEVKDESPAD